MATDAAEKPPILATGVVSLLPGNAAGTGKWTSCGIFLDHLLLKYVQCTAWYSPIAQFKEMLPSYSTRHHPLCFRNRYACWLNFCKDRGFHPKLRGANSILSLLNELWTSSSTFQVSTVIPWLYLLWHITKIISQLPKFRLHCHRFQCFTKDWVNTPKGMHNFQ